MKITHHLDLTLAVVSLLYILIGIITLAKVDLPLIYFFYAAAAALGVFGIIQIVSYFVKERFKEPNQFGFSIGVLEVILCIVILFMAPDMAVIAPQIFGALIILDSILKLQNSMDLFRLSSNDWFVNLVLALVTAVLAVILVFSPFTSENTLFIYMAILLIIDGIINLYSLLALKMSLKKYTQRGSPANPPKA